MLTIHPELATSLAKEWPGARVIVDASRTVLPEYCYSITPQMMLIENGRIEGGAIGAVDCETKWEAWNR